MTKTKKLLMSFYGFCAGVLNGLLGAGGGMVIVPILEKNGLSKKEAHATSIFVMLPLAAISAFFYVRNKTVTISDALPFIPLGVVGAIIGAKLIKKVKVTFLRFVFAAILLYSSVRMFLK